MRQWLDTTKVVRFAVFVFGGWAVETDGDALGVAAGFGALVSGTCRRCAEV